MTKAMGSYKIGNTMHLKNRAILFGAFQNKQAFFLPLVKSSKKIFTAEPQRAQSYCFFCFSLTPEE